jgi:hypothetical protein
MLDHERSVDCLYFNWINYGNSDKLQREGGQTLTSYMRRASEPNPHTKMICRSALIDPASIRSGVDAGHGTFWHFLDKYRLSGVRCRDVLHESTDGYSFDFPASTEHFLGRAGFGRAVLDKAYVAHFQFKSEADFLRRARRGGFPNSEAWRAAYETGAYKVILDRANAVYDTYLAEYWYRYTAPAMRFSVQSSPRAPYANVALNKPSWQSSVFEPNELAPPLGRSAGGGNNGVRTGVYGFHTRVEARPWWIVDLLATHLIAEIHIYNRNDDPVLATRANELDILASGDGAAWTRLASHQGSEPFGMNGTPFVVKVNDDRPYRFVMLRLRGVGCLHLDEIEVYGNPAGNDVPLIGTALSRAAIARL